VNLRQFAPDKIPPPQKNGLTQLPHRMLPHSSFEVGLYLLGDHGFDPHEMSDTLMKAEKQPLGVDYISWMCCLVTIKVYLYVQKLRCIRPLTHPTYSTEYDKYCPGYYSSTGMDSLQLAVCYICYVYVTYMTWKVAFKGPGERLFRSTILRATPVIATPDHPCNVPDHQRCTVSAGQYCSSLRSNYARTIGSTDACPPAPPPTSSYHPTIPITQWQHARNAGRLGQPKSTLSARKYYSAD